MKTCCFCAKSWIAYEDLLFMHRELKKLLKSFQSTFPSFSQTFRRLENMLVTLKSE